MGLIKANLLFLTLFFFIFSCKNSDNFIQHESGFEYRIISEQDNNLTISEGDILDLKLKYYNKKDSLIFDSEELPGKFRVQVLNPETGGLFQEAILLMTVGDSAHFLISADNFYKETMKKPVPGFIKEGERQESNLLREYIKDENITEQSIEDGLYIIKIENGKGKFAEEGKVAVVHYIGKLINGQVFDSSIDRGEPVKFLIGQGDVIPAWEKAILKMRKGDKIKLITSSKYAQV